ncbi:[protein-PII] uridylyltransferase [Rhodoferax sp.]|uniref:[protein-PII] uridylyltransferase n=1 Tax=Rhodoferax sp. TaxID=50421 RepID=UPI002726C736|nr:[protein-PII] uridylyltransferase [Rhodoferax sp.]MDO9144275.1 [protein-PII] uridylyltransferase [Rhodoferax sp.]MDP3190388.1 [protein-PII] uridylyltransferase [Rhodoferax sp.]MDP3336717.1 [protein-PII] uridylyltransferase [Rhodoferax sp.]MDP3863984.1 [protein-PII] uridylyltransferase [Rhodoferax sp.]
MSDLKSLREQFRAKKAALFQSLAEGGKSTRGVGGTLAKLAALADDTLKTLWLRAALPSSLTLAAVGGYGRGELFPYSDVDVLVLLSDDIALDLDADLKSRIEGFIGSCWDAGLEIGSSVRSVADCLSEARQDVTVQTSLLESRLITGSPETYDQFRRKFVAALDPRAFFVAKTLELNQRHSKFDNTPYSLEPNCKESPGGLRDLQVILWVAKAAGLGNNWNELAKNGLATAFEIQQIKRNEALLWLIRTRLHLIAKRREDRLIFDMQNAVAQAFGFEAPPVSADKRSFVRPSEALMKRYYWAAKAVTQLNQILLLNIEERLSPNMHEPRPINAHFSDKAGMLEVVSDDLYRREPHAILETFLVFQTAGMNGLSARTLRALYNARDLMDGAFRKDPVNRDLFMQILKQDSGITHAMRLMNQTSVLGRYLWAFRKIVGQMQHDLFHVYTVDQHVLMVLRNVRRFFIVEHAHEYPFCSQLASGWDQPWVLYVAALFHDIAKGRGGDHSQLGEIEALRFCKQHNVSRENTELIAFVVREHLTMSRVAQKTDLSDPDVIAAFAKKVGSERYLTALYLFTVADIRGTSPKVWNAWKGKLLEDLYRLSLRVLGGHTADPHVEVEARKREALIQLALHAQPFQAHKALWDTMDVGYFMRHDAADIAWHTRQLSRHVNSGKSIVRARLSPLGEGLQVLVYTPDQADLFARICGYFEHRGFSILDARVHTANNHYALDTFQVTAQAMPELYHELASMVEAELVRAILQTGPLPAPGKGRVSRRVKSFPITPRVSLQPDEKGQRWLLNISASDRVGLLYSIARVLARHKVNVQLAKINTLGERVDDTFLIDGPELQENRAQIAIETEVLEALA